MIMRATQNWTNSAHGADIAFDTTTNGTTSRLERMRITHDGRVGIGTTDPIGGLGLVASGGAMISTSAYGSGDALVAGYAFGGTPAAPSATQLGRRLLHLVGTGFTGSSNYQAASIVMYANEQWNTSGGGAGMFFTTTANGTTNPTVRMLISDTGKINIGAITDPTRAKVEINGGFGSAPLAGAYAALFSNGAATNSNGTASTPSLWASNYLVSPGYYAFSDARIKRVVGPSDAAADLATLVKIGVTDYTFVDAVAKGTGTHKKVIAQELEQVYPQAVTRTTDVVPDIYQMAPVTDGWVMLATDLKQGERVRLLGKATEGVHDVLEVADGKFRTAFAVDGDEVFVYGREVNDFRNVDYEAIAMLNVSATQELHRRVEKQATELTAQAEQIRAQTTRIAEFEAQAEEIAALKQDLAGLRAALAAARIEAAGVAAARAPQDR